MRIPLLILTLAAPVAAPDGDASSAGVQKSKAMIESLVNANTAPELIEFSAAVIPRFAERYDWDEQVRVQKAFNTLRTTQSESAWEEMVRHVDDKRYSLTLRTDGEIYTTMNYSVGMLCAILARGRLIGVLDGNVEAGDDGLPVVLAKRELWKDLATWRKHRAGKELYELQIEVCQDAIDLIASESRLSQAAKDTTRLNLQRQIGELQMMKRALFRDKFLIETYDAFDERRAKQLWEKWGSRTPVRKSGHTN